eukprot:864943-Rhodomonas_salina.1
MRQERGMRDRARRPESEGSCEGRKLFRTRGHRTQEIKHSVCLAVQRPVTAQRQDSASDRTALAVESSAADALEHKRRLFFLSGDGDRVHGPHLPDDGHGADYGLPALAQEEPQVLLQARDQGQLSLALVLLVVCCLFGLNG